MHKMLPWWSHSKLITIFSFRVIMNVWYASTIFVLMSPELYPIHPRDMMLQSCIVRWLNKIHSVKSLKRMSCSWMEWKNNERNTGDKVFQLNDAIPKLKHRIELGPIIHHVLVHLIVLISPGINDLIDRWYLFLFMRLFDKASNLHNRHFN